MSLLPEARGLQAFAEPQGWWGQVLSSFGEWGVGDVTWAPLPAERTSGLSRGRAQPAKRPRKGSGGAFCNSQDSEQRWHRDTETSSATPDVLGG